ncbi:MAG: GntR family transcriptional regulator [Methylobacteriaceae bacterium]|nr:GntR family transcriptional regulator [Methylobacteriaceae bacterium]
MPRFSKATVAAPKPAVRGAAPASQVEAWTPIRPQTLVDQVGDSIIAQAARGAILPGDRIVESELAKKLGVSRVPVRESLRILESQGIVLNEPYKGIRLRPVTNDRVRDLVEARTALETTAAQRAVAAGRNRGAALAPLRAALAEIRASAARREPYGFAAADTDFHRALCRLGGNGVLVDMWETLARQMTIIFGLATLKKPMKAIVDEHTQLLGDLESGDIARITASLHEHITVMNMAVDYEAILAARRAERARASAA